MQINIYLFLLPLGGLVAGVIGTLVFGWGWKRKWRESQARLARMEGMLTQAQAKIPLKLEIRREFHIGYWTDPTDNQRKQVWIPVAWIEYEDGSTKPLEIEGLCDKQGVSLLPFPVSFDAEKPAD